MSDEASALDPDPGRLEFPRHTVVDDVSGLLTGTFVVAFGLFLLHSVGAVTGGTAGLALLITYLTGLPFAVVFVVVNVPFFGLAAWKKGWSFTVRTAVAVVLASLFSLLPPLLVHEIDIDPVFATIAGNLLSGIGLLALFRHRASLGGFNILALLAQERLGWRAGYVQMALDALVVAGAVLVAPPWLVLVSGLGVIVLDLVLAINHRPGRYRGE